MKYRIPNVAKEHGIAQFIEGHTYTLGKPRSQNTETIEYLYDIPVVGDIGGCITSRGFFYIGGASEIITDVLRDGTLSQELKDAHIHGAMLGVLYSMAWTTCFDSFMFTE